jgi:adenylate cyclase
MRRSLPSKPRDLIAWPAIALTVFCVLILPWFDPLDRLDVDIVHATRTMVPFENAPLNPVVAVVAIDEKTYRTPPFVGLPKTLWTPQIAAVQNKVLGAGAKTFAWDIILPTSAAKYVADKRFDMPLLKSLAKWGRKNSKIVLGEFNVGGDVIRPNRALLLAAGGTKNLRSLALNPDKDGVVRTLPGFVEVTAVDGKTQKVAAIAGELASRAMGREMPPPPEDAVLKFPSDPAQIPVHSFADLVACGDDDYLTAHFKDKVVLFGAVLEIEDRKLATNRFVAPADFTGAPDGCTGSPPEVGRASRSLYPGVIIHAAAVDNLVRGAYAIPLSPPSRALVVLAFALLATLLAMRLGTWTSAGIVVLISVCWTVLVTAVFEGGTLLPLIDGLLALVLGWSGGFAYRFWVVDRERATVRASFSRYLDQNLIDDIVESGAVPDLGGERRTMTVFFSDIAAFSSLSESMSPSELVAFLNVYFEVISREIKRHDGIIERFVGDAVVALFGAPIPNDDHALNGVRCALAINTALEASQERFGLPDGKRVATRIGVNTGDMVVGNVGAENRFTYTVMGDCVNLAARLESGGKQFGTEILVGEDTRSACGDLIEFRNVDKVRVVGRDKPVELYQPLGIVDDVSDRSLHIKARYEEALANIRAVEFPAARTILETLAAEGDMVSTKTLERLAVLEADPPGPDWDGVINLGSK